VKICVHLWQKKSHAQKNAWLTSLPSAALPASGSRGLQSRHRGTGLSAIAAPPHFLSRSE